ncbi:MAG TPA: hypothetical protein PKK36_09950 [Kiritimatiellia bacterium]|nr:hypothetical protein [Kiritimatiellia bacterium]
MNKKKLEEAPRDSPGAVPSTPSTSSGAGEVAALPKSRFVQIGGEIEEDGTVSIISAWDVPNCGVVMRTKNFTKGGQFISVSEVFIPMAGVREGKITRSLY